LGTGPGAGPGLLAHSGPALLLGLAVGHPRDVVEQQAGAV